MIDRLLLSLLASQLNGMHEAAKNKQEADAKRARLESEIETTQSTFENDLNTERRKKLQEKQRVRTQVEEEIMTLSSELFSKKASWHRLLLLWCRYEVLHLYFHAGMAEDPTFAIETSVPKHVPKTEGCAVLWPAGFRVTQPSLIFTLSSMPLLSSSLLKAATFYCSSIFLSSNLQNDPGLVHEDGPSPVG